MSGYVLSVEANLDLNRDYIASDNFNAAGCWVDRFFSAFEALGQTPGMEYRREDLTSHPVLLGPVGAYLIIDRAGRLPIEIVAVAHGSRGLRFLSCPNSLSAPYVSEEWCSC